jgi:putative flippase GtrA
MRDLVLGVAEQRLGPARARLLGEFIRFGMVGTLGFLVDAGVLLAMLRLGLGPWVGRIISYICAATATYTLNRLWTFRTAEQNASWRQWGLFLLLNLSGFAFNYGTYALLLLTVPLVLAQPVLGVAAGALAGMFANFFVSRRFVFRAGR